MDKYEYRIKADAIKSLIAEGDYQSAMEIADEIDWRRVKSVMMLCTISDLYKINKRLEDSRDLLLLAYGRHPGGRTIVFSLCELSIKMGDIIQAKEYYQEFLQIAPNDSGQYILRYKLYEALDVNLEERIHTLQELKKEDYREKWAYELAKLYHRAGRAAECVEECDELILWFGEGRYVDKALDLKLLHQPLTAEQQAKYDARFVPVVEEIVAPPEDPVNEAVEESEAYISEVVAEVPVKSEDDEIHVKTMDVGEYNTINLQKEIAEGLKEVLNAPQDASEKITQSIVAPMFQETAQTPVEAIESVLISRAEEPAEVEVFFGETSEVAEETLKEISYQAAEMAVPEDAYAPEEPMTAEEEPVSEEADTTAETVMAEMRKARQTVAEPPKELAEVLSMESDGQIRIVVPKEEAVEKQITGQMSIEDILAEWERMKNENKEKREAEVRQRVLQRTGPMFTEFEAKMRDSLLEQLESEKIKTPGVMKLSDIELEDYGEIAMEVIPEEVYEDIPVPEAVEEFSDGSDGEVEELVEISEEICQEADSEPEEALEAESEEGAEPETDIQPEAMNHEAESLKQPEKMVTEPSKEKVEISSPKQEEVKAVEEAEASEEDKGESVQKQKLRALTPEERELFAPFIQGKASREQLIKTLDSISMAPYTGNVVITGPEGVNTIGLAKNIVRDVQASDNNFSGKTAKISGSSMESRDVEELTRDMANGALIIQKASGMSEKSIADLCKALQQEQPGILVIIEDTKKAMNRLLDGHKELAEYFTARVDVDALSDDALVAFARKYAREMEYSIDEMGVLSLHRKIDELQTSDHVVTVLEVKQMMDEAIRHANRKNLAHFFDILLGKRYDDEDMIILRENDFI